MTRRLIVWIAALVISAGVSRPALAALEATPYAGAMIPANSLLLFSTTGYIRLQTHTLYGVGIGAPLNDRFGVEAVLGVGTGKIELSGGGLPLGMGSTMFLADLRGTVRLAGTNGSQLGLVLGAGYTDVNAGLFDSFHENGLGTFIGRLTGVTGLQYKGNLSEILHVRVDVLDRIHLPGAALTGFSDAARKTQNDIVTTLGLTVSLR